MSDSKYEPFYQPLSTKEPSPTELKINKVFMKAYEEEIQLESEEELGRRNQVLNEVRQIFLTFVKDVAREKMLSEELVQEARGELFTSGSYRLGVRDIDADVDLVCVVPNFCTKEDFFSTLKKKFVEHPDVTNLNAVEAAFVPLISFDFRRVSIDLLFAQLSQNVIPERFNITEILDDNILTGLDDKSVRSLNGPRVTNMISKLIKNQDNFLIVLRIVRKWAKRRGLYGNKFGYLGGVNCNILVAFICQLYPNSCPSALLIRFFKNYRDWSWPKPIQLNNVQPYYPGTNILNTEVWIPETNPNDLMPILTPAYPVINSTNNVSKHSFAVMKMEFDRGYKIIESILKAGGKDADLWKKIFDKSDFFLRYNHYLACHMIGTGKDPESIGWIAYVESRIRRFLPYLEDLPLQMPINLYPVLYPTAKSANSICYFIGFNIDYEAFEATGRKPLPINERVHDFK